MLQLMNSAMMPAPGTYVCQKIDADKFCVVLVKAVREGLGFKSSIGYPQTAELIEKLSGVKVEVSREPTTLQDGDRILVCKLKYRHKNPGDKGHRVSEDDFEFFDILYRCDD